MLILLLTLAFMAVFVLIFRAPAPKIDRLLLFLVWLALGAILAYMFAVRVLHWDPDPTRLNIAHLVTGDKIIDLTQIVPGLPRDLDSIYRVDVDAEGEEEATGIKNEWLVVYRYDVVRDANGNVIGGPFGAAVYDPGLCRPPSIFSFELVPLSYDYLGQDGVRVAVEEIIAGNDEALLELQGKEGNRPEIIIAGLTDYTVTDLNIFRKVGAYDFCDPLRKPVTDPYAETISLPFKYQVIGSFRGTYSVERYGSTVAVQDSAGFERSQIVVRRVYYPNDKGTYLALDPASNKYVLQRPGEIGLAFGPGRPEDTRRVYYPEKTVLAFFLDLGANTERAMDYTCQGKGRDDYDPANFGLELPASQLSRVIVCELSYHTDEEAERAHTDRTVGVKVVEVPAGGSQDCVDARALNCLVVAQKNPNALPYGCEWCLYGCTQAP